LTEASILKIAEALDADQVVFGRFQLAPPSAGAPEASRGTIGISASILAASRLRKGPEFRESGPLEDLVSLQLHLAWQVLRHVAPELAPPADQFLKEQPPVRLDAMENYTRGLLAANPEQKHRYFTQAVRIDERFPQAYYELGRLYWDRKEYRLAADWLARVKESTPHSMEAKFLLGLCRYYGGDYEGAQAAFQLVAGSVPLNEVFNNLGAAQSRRNLAEALENFRKALEGDPADPDYHFNVGYALWKRSEFTAAADSFRAVLDRNPDDQQATLLLGRCLGKTGPRQGERNQAGLERMKVQFEESAYRQLKAALEARGAK
jgi:tetratricopeptide (TPR) repeat protein